MGQKRGLNRQIVLDSAVRLVEERGMSQLGIQSLACRLEVKPASLYNHISGVEELSHHLARHAMHQLEQAISDAAVGRAGRDAFRAMAKAYRGFAKDHPELYKAYIWSNALEGDDIHEAQGAIVRVFLRVLRADAQPAEQDIHFTRGLRSALHGFVSLEEAGFFKNPAGVEDSFNEMIDGLLCQRQDL